MTTFGCEKQVCVGKVLFGLDCITWGVLFSVVGAFWEAFFLLFGVRGAGTGSLAPWL